MLTQILDSEGAFFHRYSPRTKYQYITGTLRLGKKKENEKQFSDNYFTSTSVLHSHVYSKTCWKQGSRRYIPLIQPTAQQVMVDTISDGPTTVILIGALTNFAIFLMTHPELKRNVEHIYVMGGGVRSKNPEGCCLKSNTSCKPSGQCGITGNLFTAYMSNPYAEFNIFVDPFAAYQVR